MTTTRIIDITTGDIDLRHFDTAAEARRELGRRLVWEREDEEWVAVDGDVEYRVETDSGADAI